MQKIKDDLIQKLYKIPYSKITYVTFLDLINYADEKGRVQVYYKDMVESIGCSVAQFYNALNALVEYGLIRKNKDLVYKKEINITIVGNDFTDKAGYRNYVDTNKIFFTEQKYKELRAGEIRVYLYFLFRVEKQQRRKMRDDDKNKLYYDGAYTKIAKSIGITVRMLKEYCAALKKAGFINIAEKQVDGRFYGGKKYDVITANKSTMQEPFITATEKGVQTAIKPKPLFLHWRHYIKNLCRRYHIIDYDELNLTDTALLMNQYAKKAKEQDKDIYGVLKNAILNLKDEVLDSKTIHHIVRSLIGIDYAEGIIAY